MKHYFIAGTDTDVGKTFVTRAMMQGLRDKYSVLGYKPVSAGCEMTPAGLRNEDALILQQYASLAVSYDEVNPIAFADPVAPHLAAQQLGQTIALQALKEGLKVLSHKQPDWLLVEGAGGWRLPLGNGQWLSQLAIDENMPVILVVGMKLGCLNHAQLSVEAILADGLELAGWVANFPSEEMAYGDENLAALKAMIPAPCLGVVPRLDNPDEAMEYLDLASLLSS